MKFTNYTNLKIPAKFIRKFLEKKKTELPKNRKQGKELKVYLKYVENPKWKTNFSGFVRQKDFTLSCRVNKSIKFPYKIKESVGSIPSDNRRKWDYIYKHFVFNNLSEVLIYVAFHEIWHFGCYVKWRGYRGNVETKANKYGMKMVKKYRKYLNE